MTKDVHTTQHHAGDKTEMESYVDTPYSDQKISPSLHDDTDLHTSTAAVGEGLQRNLQARHLTMISLGKRPLCFLSDPSVYLSHSVSLHAWMVPLCCLFFFTFRSQPLRQMLQKRALTICAMRALCPCLSFSVSRLAHSDCTVISSLFIFFCAKWPIWTASFYTVSPRHTANSHNDDVDNNLMHAIEYAQHLVHVFDLHYFCPPWPHFPFSVLPCRSTQTNMRQYKQCTQQRRGTNTLIARKEATGACGSTEWGERVIFDETGRTPFCSHTL